MLCFAYTISRAHECVIGLSKPSAVFTHATPDQSQVNTCIWQKMQTKLRAK